MFPFGEVWERDLYGIVWVSLSLVPRPSRPSVCRLQYFPRVSTASDKRWGEKAWVRG